MPQVAKTVILPARYYHIFNRGINRRAIFKDEQDFQRFLKLLKKYMGPVGMVFAFALLEDHFHLLVGIHPAKDLDPRFLTDEKALGRTFGHLQNAYAKYFNTRYGTVSGLFERSFEREEVDTLAYFKNLVVYLHQNPVNHGYCKRVGDYMWTSYQEMTTPSMDTFVERDKVFEKLGGMDGFNRLHGVVAEDGLIDVFEF